MHRCFNINHAEPDTGQDVRSSLPVMPLHLSVCVVHCCAALWLVGTLSFDWSLQFVDGRRRPRRRGLRGGRADGEETRRRQEAARQEEEGQKEDAEAVMIAAAAAAAADSLTSHSTRIHVHTHAHIHTHRDACRKRCTSLATPSVGGR